MSDISAGGDLGGVGGDAPAAPATNPLLSSGSPTASQQSAAIAADQAAADKAAGVVSDPFDDDKITTFDRKYVEKLRGEAAAKRTALKGYEDNFGDFGDEDRALWLSVSKELGTAMKSGDPAKIAAAADQLDKVAKALRGGEQTAPAPAANSSSDKPLTAADVDRILAEREASRGVTDKVKALGYSDDANDPDRHMLLWLATTKTGYDLDAAHKLLQDRDQATFDRMVKKANAAKNAPAPVTNSGQAGGSSQPIKGWQDSRAALEAAIDSAWG